MTGSHKGERQRAKQHRVWESGETQHRQQSSSTGLRGAGTEGGERATGLQGSINTNTALPYAYATLSLHNKSVMLHLNATLLLQNDRKLVVIKLSACIRQVLHLRGHDIWTRAFVFTLTDLFVRPCVLPREMNSTIRKRFETPCCLMSSLTMHSLVWRLTGFSFGVFVIFIYTSPFLPFISLC